MAKVLEINFGALAPDIGAQLKQCGLTASARDIELWTQDVEELARLRIRGIVSDNESRKAEGRIFKAIKKGVK